MDKRNFAKLVLNGMAAGSLIVGSQLVAADENLESNRDSFLASAGCKGPGGCGGNGNGQPPQQYRNYTADNDAGYGQGNSYPGSSTPSGSYNTGSSSSNPYQGSSGYNSGSSYQSSPGSSNYYNSPSQPRGSSQTQSGQFNTPSSSMNNPAYPEQQKNLQGGRYLAADDTQEGNIIASEDGEQQENLFVHEGHDHDDSDAKEASIV